MKLTEDEYKEAYMESIYLSCNKETWTADRYQEHVTSYLIKQYHSFNALRTNIALMQFFTGTNLYYSLLSFNILVGKEITNISSFTEILKLQDLQYYDDFHIKY